MYTVSVMKNTNQHYLADPETGSRTSFEPNGATVIVTEHCHPDLPAKVSELSLADARDAYRLCVKRGMVAA